jgi:hypothetical protein
MDVEEELDEVDENGAKPRRSIGTMIRKDGGERR